MSPPSSHRNRHTLRIHLHNHHTHHNLRILHNLNITNEK